jgi:hypothetical protein
VHKHPERVREVELTSGKAIIFHPEAAGIPGDHEALRRFVSSEPIDPRLQPVGVVAVPRLAQAAAIG